MYCINHWIPAFAGMTEVARVKAIGLSMYVYCFVVILACLPQAGLEQAAEESDDEVPPETMIKSEYPQENFQVPDKVLSPPVYF